MGKHRIVVAGCGGMSRLWLDYAQSREGIEIAALVDLHEETARSRAAERGLEVPVFTDLAEALSKVEADLVFDVTIPASHRAVVTTALEAGCHVFGEKPMAETWEDAKAIARVAERTGRRYAVMQNRRYNRQIRALRDLVAAGTVGKVGSIHADFFVGPHFGGFRDAMESPLIVDMAIHTFDQARFISGADPVSVYCHEYNPPGSWYRGNASAACIFEMSDGSVFTYRGSWCAEGFPTSWEADWRIVGSRGTARWDGRSMPEAEIVDEAAEPGFIRPVRRVEATTDWSGREGHPGCLDEMFAALEAGRPAETDCTDNLKSMAMVFGALESARTGRKVMLDI
jgi:predicted dehydrogenase